MTLNWRVADRRTSRQNLQAFVCVDPSSSASWARDVQSFIRGLKPPGPPNRCILVGYTDDGKLAAVIWLEYGHADDAHFVRCLGRSIEVRGGRVGDEIVTVLIEHLRDWNERHGVGYGVYGKVHESNMDSEWMCRRHGFRHIEEWDEGDGYRHFGRQV